MTAKKLEVSFRLLRETWFNANLEFKKEQAQDYSENKIEIYRNPDSTDKALQYRKKCLDLVKEDLINTTKLDEESILQETNNLTYMVRNESKVRLSDIYMILKNKHKK